MLYLTTTLDLQSESVLRQLRVLLLPQRLASITSVVFRWLCTDVNQPQASPEAKARYDDMWENFASMSELRRLRIAVHASPCSPLASRQHNFGEAWLSPLDKLSKLHLEVFDFAISASYHVHFQRNRQAALFRLLEIFDRTLGGPCW